MLNGLLHIASGAFSNVQTEAAKLNVCLTGGHGETGQSGKLVLDSWRHMQALTGQSGKLVLDSWRHMQALTEAPTVISVIRKLQKQTQQ